MNDTAFFYSGNSANKNPVYSCRRTDGMLKIRTVHDAVWVEYHRVGIGSDAQASLGRKPETSGRHGGHSAYRVI